ncbi:TonB-dependent receptor [Halomonas sp. DQ26W]|uniref:TonB-dependent receptor domain-containing protein n=1 Tax=Halomonas sp. DQ26W TaxID=2282311 RepID=UPI000DF80A0C|nr:TonB-dependent receptor [Halomonas sp. DQ26W]RDB43987.1 TonB-dependent receptor [Halomonas sp. DQ26W]
MKIKHQLAAQGLAAFGLAALPLAVQAQVASTETADTVSLNPMVVTATLAPRTADETLSSVTLLDEATLRRQDPVELTDLFRGQPGVDVSSTGSLGKQTTLSIRGGNNKQSQLLIDGIRLQSATLGESSWQYLDPRMFERAEIVRGPKGSLYGADAVGGVVQLFTHGAQEGGPHPRISVGGGSFNTQRYSAGLSGSSGGTRYSFAGSHFSTDGAPIRRGGEDKGYDNTTGLVRLAHTFDGGAEIGMLALRAKGNTEFDNGETDFVQQVAGIYGEIQVTEAWRSRLTLSESRDESDNFDQDRTLSSIIDTRTQSTRWENTLGFGLHELVAGAEYSEDRVTSTTPYDETRRDNTAVFAQVLFDFSPFSVQAALRHDDNQAFGEETTGSLAFGFDMDAYHTLRTSYGTAFRAPTFNELYWPGDGNPDLSAETSETLEVGVRGQYSAWFWDAALYQTNVDNLIAGWPPENVDEARIRGIELSSGAEIDDWILAAALTYTDPENRSGINEGKRIRRLATKSFRLDADREMGDWMLGGSWIAQNNRYNDAANEQRIAGYGQVNLRAGWNFAPMWSARMTIDNVFDKEVVTAMGSDFDFVTFESTPFDYINTGRAAFLSVHFGQ